MHEADPRRTTIPLQFGSENVGARPLSFSQALQYTPLAASMLPVHDRIPLPQVVRPRESARLTSSNERKAMQQLLMSFPVGKVQSQLSGLLKGENLAEIKFRQRPTDNVSGHQQTQNKIPDHGLSSTAKMVLDMSTIDYRYRSTKHSAKKVQSISERDGFQHRQHGSRKQADYPDSILSTDQISVVHKSPTSSRLNGPAPVVIKTPNVPASIAEKGLTNLKDIAKRENFNHNDQQIPLAVHVRSQRDASDAVLLNFQNSLMEIFEAQDQVDAGSTSVQQTDFFEDQEDGEESEPNLSIKTLERLQLSLKKLVGLKRLTDLSVEHLQRLQRFCEPPIDRAQTINLKLPSHPSADDEDEWVDKIQRAENGIVSAAVSLYTILGCPNEESLLSTDARTWIPNVLSNIFETCLIPVIEARPDGQDAELFIAAGNNKDRLRRLLESSKKLLDVVSTVCAEVKGMDFSVNPIEFLCVKLIFVQNSTIDKHSCLGIQTFEKVRKTAMSCLARLYARHAQERATILDEVLSSLDRLPSNSRGARQYKLGNGKSIQLITALFMQLVQTTALELPELGSKAKRKAHMERADDIINSDDDNDEDLRMPAGEAELQASPLQRLQTKATKLFDASARSAHDIIVYLVSRASKTTKTGDSPYRNILDLFIEDLIAVLPDPEWPSSELMLRMMARKMINLANNDKAAAIKNMALESLGAMGSAICAQKALIPSLSAALERDGQDQSDVSAQLCDLARSQESGTLRAEDMIDINGPFAIVSRQLWSEANQNLRVRSACGYFLAHFAKLVARLPDTKTHNNDDIEGQSVRVANWLLDLIPHVGSDSIIQSFEAVDSDEAELGYALCILNVGFCSYFGDVVKTLASSFSSDQALVRSRSLKSVVSMLEADPALLDRDQSIVDDIFKCASDESALVRDSALSLIARFIIPKPALQQRGIKRLLECASDSKVGVQKRAISHLRDVYINDDRENLRSRIAFTFLERTGDHEETVAELARKTLNEIWIGTTLSSLTNAMESKQRIATEALSMDMVRCVAHNPEKLVPLLQAFFVYTLKSEPKIATKTRELGSNVVDELFEKTISGDDEKGPLYVLAAFAAADSQLIKAERLAKLQSYLGNVKSDNDLFMFRSVIRIYSSVLPDLSATHKPLLADIQSALMKAIPSLGRRDELDPLMSCLHTIDGVLKNTLKVVKFTASVFNGIKANRDVPQRLERLLRIAGAIARYLDFEDYLQAFSAQVNGFQGKSVAAFMASTFNALTSSDLPIGIRALALEGLGSLCQASPVQFNNKAVRATLFSALKISTLATGTDVDDTMKLQTLVLKTFDDLYAQRAQAKAEQDKNEANGDKQELGKLGGDSKTRDGDSALIIITREVVNHVLDIALTTQGENALLAASTLASISHEGLIHPKQSTGAFVALGTSEDPKIANVAHDAHRLLHQNYETVCEREYTHAVQQAFEYQSTVVGDSCGAWADGFRAKLGDCFGIINISSAKYIKKFLSGLVTKIVNEVAAQDTKGYTIGQVLAARFVLQNMAFFEYRKVDDLLHTILQLELAYSKGGGEIVQLLEQHLPHDGLSDVFVNNSMTEGVFPNAPTESSGNMDIVRRLAPIAVTLTLLIETRSYLVRQYAIGRDVRAAINNSKQAKDSGKAPTKVYGINGEKTWNRMNNAVNSLDDETSMIECCRSFIGLMSMDEDVELDNEVYTNDGELGGDAQAQIDSKSATPGNRKRKGSASIGNTPSKRPRQRNRRDQRRSESFSSTGEPDDDYEI